MDNKKQKFIDFFIEFIYLSIIFLIPVYFNFFFIGSDPFELSKMILFRGLFFIFLFLSVLRFVFLKNFPLIFGVLFKKYFYIPIALLAFLAISLFWAIDPHLAFFGSSFRQLSFLSELFFIAFSILLTINLIISDNKKKQVKRLFIIMALSSFFVSVYAICQYFGLDFLIWDEPAKETGRAMSTLGQPNFLGSFLLLTIPVSIYLFFKNKKILPKIIFSIIFLSQFSALLFSGSRGAWLGLLIGFLITVLYFKKNKKILYSVLALFAVSLLFLLFTNNSFSERFKDGFNFSQGSSSVRASLYRDSLRAGFNNFLGVGMENQREALVPYYEIDFARYSKVNIIFDRAHNIFLDIMITLGFLGLVFYFIFYYFIFKIVNKNILSAKDSRWKFLMIFLAISSYLVSLIFGFSTVVTSLYFFVFLAVIFALDFKWENHFSSNPFLESYEKNSIIKFLIIILFLLLCSWGLLREFKNFRADYYYLKSKEDFFRGEVPSSMVLFSYFKEDNIWHQDYDALFIAMIFDNFSNFRDNSSQALAKEQVDQISQSFSNKKRESFFYRLTRAQILALQGDFDEADLILQDLSEESPSYPEIYLKKAKLERLRGDNDKALENYQKTLELLPEEGLVEEGVNLRALLLYKNMIYSEIDKILN